MTKKIMNSKSNGDKIEELYQIFMPARNMRQKT